MSGVGVEIQREIDEITADALDLKEILKEKYDNYDTRWIANIRSTGENIPSIVGELEGKLHPEPRGEYSGPEEIKFIDESRENSVSLQPTAIDYMDTVSTIRKAQEAFDEYETEVKLENTVTGLSVQEAVDPLEQQHLEVDLKVINPEGTDVGYRLVDGRFEEFKKTPDTEFRDEVEEVLWEYDMLRY